MVWPLSREELNFCRVIPSLTLVEFQKLTFWVCRIAKLHFLLWASKLRFWAVSLKAKDNSTRCSQAVTHPSTNRAQRCLTSVIGREPVFSTWYGRCRRRRQKLGYMETWKCEKSIFWHFLIKALKNFPEPGELCSIFWSCKGRTALFCLNVRLIFLNFPKIKRWRAQSSLGFGNIQA